MLHDDRRSEAENDRGEDQKEGWNHGQNLTVLREMQRCFCSPRSEVAHPFAAPEQASEKCYEADLAFAAALFSRALRRFAAFLWMTPAFRRLIERGDRARGCFPALPSPAAWRFASERRLVVTLRLRRVRFGLCRARLEADLVLAMSQDFRERRGSWTEAKLSNETLPGGHSRRSSGSR